MERNSDILEVIKKRIRNYDDADINEILFEASLAISSLRKEVDLLYRQVEFLQSQPRETKVYPNPNWSPFGNGMNI